jgi:8-hydroxy-5-deazaflavin:NADPH oxidoreductase
MRFAVLGTGVVGQALATRLAYLGHEVVIGSREAGENKETFADAAANSDIVINATSGVVSLDALALAGAENLDGKILIDVANPLDFSGGMPPTLSVCNSDSLAEQIQREFPGARVVKTLNTVNAEVMGNPGLVPGDHTIFVCGNDDAAKAEVTQLLQSFGWPPESIFDFGDITGARAVEMYLPMWLRLMMTLGTPRFSIKVVRG